MDTTLYAIEFEKHVDLPRVVNFLISLGHPISKLKQKHDVYRFEYKPIKELKKQGYNLFIPKKVDEYITFIFAEKSKPGCCPAVALSCSC
jgi:uncharacterized protein YcgL (UPF0745 family)